MKNIETPLTWGLGVLAIVLIVLSSLNTTSTDFNISNVNSEVNDGFNLNHDHQIQEVSSFNIKDPNTSIAAMAEGLSDSSKLIEVEVVDWETGERVVEVISEEGDQKIIIVADDDTSDE